MIPEQSNLVKKTAENFLKAMGEDGGVEIEHSQDKKDILVKLNLSDPQFLIGPKGAYLEAFERLLRSLVRKKAGQDQEIFLSVDINNYRKRRIEFIKNLTREIGDQVLLSGKPVSLEPMSAFERRIVHAEVSERDGLTSESVGEEPERWVVIKPKSEI
jgi:spoIIIJ-associated protein